VHVASGRDWRGHKFIRSEYTPPEEVNCHESRGVVYFALERADLTRRRLRAYMERDGLSDLPIAVISQPIHLLDPACVPTIQHTLHQFFDDTSAMPGLVIIDTWGKAIAPHDPDNAATQDLAAQHIKQIRDGISNGVKRFHLATIGHSGKNLSAGERGSNARQAHVDLEVQVSGGAAKITKANDQGEGDLTKFEFDKVTIRDQDEGDEMPPWTVAILAAHTPAKEARTAVSKPTPKQTQALDALHRVMVTHGQDGVVHADYWKEELTKVGLLKADAKNPWQPFKRIKESLTQQIIEVDGQVRFRILPPPIPLTLPHTSHP
jgi:hypothetical protein